jgi:glycosyltransferase involved in cell wall biosynthesis
LASISAIIPNYNHGSKIGAAVSALVAQSLPPDEIIIVDDGSTDDSVEVIEKLAAGNQQIRFIRHDRNKGAIAALNTGLVAATGSFVYMAAADDVSKANLLKTLYGALQKCEMAGLASGEILLRPVNNAKPSVRPPARPSDSLHCFDPHETARLFEEIDNFILTGAALLRLAAVREANYLQPELGAFADGFLVRQLAFRYGFVFVPEILAEWHVNDEGLSRSSALNAEASATQMLAADHFFTADTSIPEWYWPILRRRWTFAIVRISINAPQKGRSVLSKYAPGPLALRPLFVMLSHRGKLAHLICLAWATMWYRPMSMYRLVRTYLVRMKRTRTASN